MFGNVPANFSGIQGTYEFSGIKFIANCNSEVALTMAEYGLSMQQYAAEMNEFLFNNKPMEHIVVLSENLIFFGDRKDDFNGIRNGAGMTHLVYEEFLKHVNAIVFETIRLENETRVKRRLENIKDGSYENIKTATKYFLWYLNPDFKYEGLSCPDEIRKNIENLVAAQNKTEVEEEASEKEDVIIEVEATVNEDSEESKDGIDIIHFLPIIDHEPIQDESETAKPEVAVTTESEPIIVPATENPEPKPTTTEELINTNKRKCRNYYLSRGLVKKTKKGYTVKFINMDPKKTEFLKLEDVMSKVEELKANLQTMCKQVEVYVTPREFLKSNKTEKQAVREIDAAVKNKYLSLKDIDKAVATFSKLNTYVIDIVAYDDDGAVFKPFCCSIDFIGCIERYKMENGKKVEGELRPQIFLGASLLLDGEEITNMYRGKEDKNICIIKQIPCSSANIDSIFRQICKSYCDSIVNANPLSIDSYQIQSPAPDAPEQQQAS